MWPGQVAPCEWTPRNDTDPLAITERGRYIEFCGIGTMGQFKRSEDDEMAEFIRTIGVDNCLLTSDAFSNDCPSPPEFFRRFVSNMLNQGFSEAGLETVVKTNPAELIGI